MEKMLQKTAITLVLLGANHALAGGLWLLPILLVAFPLATIAVYQQIGAIDDQEIAALIEAQSSKSINLA